MTEHSYAISCWLNSCLEGFALSGRDKNKIIAKAGIAPDVLSRTYVNAEEVHAVFESAYQLYGPAIGLEACKGMVPGSLGFLSFGLLVADDIQSGLNFFCRNHKALTNALFFEFENNETDPRLKVEIKDGLNLHTSIVCTLIATTTLAFRSIRPKDKVVRSVSIALPEPDNVSMYESCFNAPIEWGATATTFHLSPELMRIKSIHANPQLMKHYDRLCDESIAEIEVSEFLYYFKKVAREALKTDAAKIQHISAELNMSVRSLQRRLSEEKTSFQVLLDSIRQSEATRLVVSGKMSIGDIAHRIGFSDASNFSRAFNRWHSCSPGQYRSHSCP